MGRPRPIRGRRRPGTRNAAREARRGRTKSLPVVGLWEIWSTLPQIADLATNTKREQDRAAWSSFAQVLERWNERTPDGTLLDYRTYSETEDFEASPLLSYQADEHDRVTVATLHQAKGLDFDVVFIADAVEGVFPDLRTRDSLLGTRHLQPHLPSDTVGYLSFRLQEERRLAYTAMTRATRRVVWTTTDAGFDSTEGSPSRFIPLAAGVATAEEAAADPEAPSRPITVEQIESELRRTASDPAARPAERLGAVETLARSADLGLRPASRFAGTMARGPDTGVVHGPIYLSPSQAVAYETCPRRYVLERKLGIGAEASVYMEFGTLVHAVIDRVERAAAERGDRHGTLDEALDVARRSADAGFVRGRRLRPCLARTSPHGPRESLHVVAEHGNTNRIGGRTLDRTRRGTLVRACRSHRGS